MIAIYNVKDSYDYYRKSLLGDRLDTIKASKDSAIKQDKDVLSLRKEYIRYPTTVIKRIEARHNIVPEYTDPGQTTYLAIVLGYMKFLMRKVLEGYWVRLGAKLGIIYIIGSKVTPRINKDGKIIGLIPSWSKTKIKWTEEATKLGLTFKEYIEQVPREKRELVYCFNEHSEYVRYSMVWIKKNVIVTNKTFYRLTFNRANKRAVWKAAIEGKEYTVKN